MAGGSWSEERTSMRWPWLRDWKAWPKAREKRVGTSWESEGRKGKCPAGGAQLQYIQAKVPPGKEAPLADRNNAIKNRSYR
eukprot:1033536-Pyramimonas_sp.AAC.1